MKGQETNRQKLAVEKRKTYEEVDNLRRRFGRMAGAGLLSADVFNSLSTLLASMKRLVAEVDLNETDEII